MLRTSVTRALALSCLVALAAPPVALASGNGRLPDWRLAPIWFPRPGAAPVLERGAAAAWNTMRLCADAARQKLYPVTRTAAYRPYARQVSLWRRYRGGSGWL